MPKNKEQVRRWEAMYDDMQNKINRQAAGIERLLRGNQIGMEALLEIAAGESSHPENRARRAADQIAEVLAADTDNKE